MFIGDVLALTWYFLASSGPPKIKQFLAGRLESFKTKSFKSETRNIWIFGIPILISHGSSSLFLDFEAGDIAYNGSNIAPSIPQAYGSWQCDIIQTPRHSARYACLTITNCRKGCDAIELSVWTSLTVGSALLPR